MPKEPDINDMREKLRRKKKEKSQSLQSRLSDTGDDEDKGGVKPPDGEPNKDQTGVPDETSKIDDNTVDTLDDTIPVENHYDYQPEHHTSETEQPEPSKKEKQPFKLPKIKITPARLLMLAAVLGVVLLGVLVWYVLSDASNVKQITYSGNEVITDEELSARLQFEEGDKMFNINTERAEENIALLPVIVDVNVEREWWNTVTISVEEYNIIAYIENEGGFNPVMNNARVLRGYPTAPSNGPILYQFEGEEFENVVTEMQNIDTDILMKISEIHYTPSEQSETRVHIFMNDGQEIVGDYRDFGEKMNHYVGMKREIGEDNEGIIDIEVGSSFLPYGSSEAEDIKQGIYELPVQAEYIDNINTSLGSVKTTLNQIGENQVDGDPEETEMENDETDSD